MNPHTPPQPVIELDARVTVRNFDLSFAIQPGERVALIGSNGAGKSTSLMLIAGLLVPDEGTVKISGHTVAGPTTWIPAHKRGLALMSQEPLLFPHLTAAENIAFPLKALRASARLRKKDDGAASAPVADMARLSKAQIAARVSDLLARVGCEDVAGRRPHELSGGQAQRVALARALAANPDVVLLDEPLSALDAGAAVAMRELLSDVLQGATAVMVTHSLADVEALATRVIRLEGGRIVQDEPWESPEFKASIHDWFARS